MKYQNAVYAMRRLNKKLFYISMQEFESYGVNIGMSRIMLTMLHNPDYNQKAISEELNFTQGNMSVHVKKLKEMGYITAEASDEDRRSKVLRLTDEGMKVLKCVKAVLNEVDRELFSGFSDEEIEVFSDFIRRLEVNADGIKI